MNAPWEYTDILKYPQFSKIVFQNNTKIIVEVIKNLVKIYLATDFSFAYEVNFFKNFEYIFV